VPVKVRRWFLGTLEGTSELWNNGVN